MSKYRVTLDDTNENANKKLDELLKELNAMDEVKKDLEVDDDNQITQNPDNVFEVIDTLKLGENLSVTLKGKCADIKNGSKLKDSSGNIYNVISVGMTRFDKPTDIIQYIDVLFMPCALAKGAQLYYVPDEG